MKTAAFVAAILICGTVHAQQPQQQQGYAIPIQVPPIVLQPQYQQHAQQPYYPPRYQPQYQQPAAPTVRVYRFGLFGWRPLIIVGGQQQCVGGSCNFP